MGIDGKRREASGTEFDGKRVGALEVREWSRIRK